MYTHSRSLPLLNLPWDADFGNYDWPQGLFPCILTMATSGHYHDPADLDICRRFTLRFGILGSAPNGETSDPHGSYWHLTQDSLLAGGVSLDKVHQHLSSGADIFTWCRKIDH